jgi:acetyltransferase-like isoleucine patch superfamily enzyme
MLKEILKKYNFCLNADRIGPDIIFTHWNLHFKSRMILLGRKKFYFFDSSAEIRPGAYIVGCSQISIGKNVVIRPGTQLHGETETLDVSIIIEDDVLIGSGVHIYVENHNFSDVNTAIYYQGHSHAMKVVLKEGCWIGANSIILPGITIGKNSVVGAGSIVTKSVPDYTVVAGNPARKIKEILEKNEQSSVH